MWVLVFSDVIKIVISVYLATFPDRLRWIWLIVKDRSNEFLLDIVWGKYSVRGFILLLNWLIRGNRRFMFHNSQAEWAEYWFVLYLHFRLLLFAISLPQGYIIAEKCVAWFFDNCAGRASYICILLELFIPIIVNWFVIVEYITSTEIRAIACI